MGLNYRGRISNPEGKGGFKKGHPQSNTGKTHFKNGSSSWCKGKKGIHLSPETEFKKGDTRISGKNSSQWKGGISKRKGYSNFYKKQYKYRKRGAIGLHTKKEWEDLKEHYLHMCLCCKKQEPEVELTEDHIIPLSRGGTNFIENIQPLCRSCNGRKNNKTIDYTGEDTKKTSN